MIFHIPGLGSLIYALTGSKAALPWGEAVHDEYRRHVDNIVGPKPDIDTDIKRDRQPDSDPDPSPDQRSKRSGRAIDS